MRIERIEKPNIWAPIVGMEMVAAGCAAFVLSVISAMIIVNRGR